MAIVGHPRFAGGYDHGRADVSESSAQLAALYQLLDQAQCPSSRGRRYARFRVLSRTDRRRSHQPHHASLRQWWRRCLPEHWHGPRFSGTTGRQPTGHFTPELTVFEPSWTWRRRAGSNHSGNGSSGSRLGRSASRRYPVLFDFNRAPFFQSFLEVRVERSKRRVVLILNGVAGPLHWRDLQIGGTVHSPEATPDDPVEFVVPMD